MTRKKKTEDSTYKEMYDAIETIRAFIIHKRAHQDKRRTTTSVVLGQLDMADVNLVVTRNHLQVVERIENARQT